MKNLENIPKAKKEIHLRFILEGWSKVILYTCVGFKDIIDVRELEDRRNEDSSGLAGESRCANRSLDFLNIPVVISEIVRKDLGSQKLSLQLKDDELAQSLTDAFLQAALYADLKLPEYLNRLKGVSNEV
ncbi:hypothetical protein ACU4GH_37440 [Bradyrhizobium betae]